MIETTHLAVSDLAICDFIRKHMVIWRDCKHSDLKYWVDWALTNGFLTCMGTGKLEGVAISRPVMNTDDAKDPFEFDPEGPVIFVDLCIATSNEILRGLVIYMVKRWGVRQWVAWNRRGGQKLVTIQPARAVNKILRKAIV